MTPKLRSIALLLIATAPFVHWSCAPGLKDSDTEETYSYPLSVGNSWKYDYTFRSEKYRKRISDSIFIPVDTVLFYDSMTEQVTVDRIDSTTVDVVTMVVRDSVWYPASDDTIQTDASWSWYRNNPDGLYEYAYITTGCGAMPKKAVSEGIRYKGKMFANVSLLAAFFNSKASTFLAKTSSATRSPTVHPIPRKALLYPYSADTLWHYTTGDSNVRIARNYIGKEKASCKAGTFTCYKIQWLRDWDADGTWDDDCEQYDWISPNDGLIKRIFYFYDLEEIDLSGSVVAKFDCVQEYQATEISLSGR